MEQIRFYNAVLSHLFAYNKADLDLPFFPYSLSPTYPNYSQAFEEFYTIVVTTWILINNFVSNYLPLLKNSKKQHPENN